MTRKLKTRTSVFAALAFGFTLSTPAQATHFHFEDYGTADVIFDSTDEASNTFTWSFKLEEDTMDLWELADSAVQSQSYDFTSTIPDDIGNMDEEDILHYAYLTMKFINVNDGGHDSDIETVDLLLDVTTLWTNYTISQGGTGNIDVTSRLYNDHMLDVTITALTGSFTVDFLDLAGCYEDVAPVPEPATMLLFGTGIIGIAGFSRKKIKKNLL